MPLLAVAEQLSAYAKGSETGGAAAASAPLKPATDASSAPLVFVGSRSKQERELVEAAGYRFYHLHAGKLRRYLSWRNLIAILVTALGFMQSWLLLGRLRPRLVFAKGGYVTVPLVFAAWLRRIPVVIHESDSVPGWSNRLLGRLAGKVIIAYPSAAKYFKASKVELLGNPVRASVMQGERKRGLKFLGFGEELPVMLIIGGSQGALGMNLLLEEILPRLVEEWQIVHLTGVGKGTKFRHKNYRAFDFVQEELGDIFAATHLAVTRAGANTLAELADWGIPAIIFPLPGSANNHQQLNADFYSSRGAAFSFDQEAVNLGVLETTIKELHHATELRHKMSKAMKELAQPEAAKAIARRLATLI